MYILVIKENMRFKGLQDFRFLYTTKKKSLVDIYPQLLNVLMTRISDGLFLAVTSAIRTGEYSTRVGSRS